MHLTIVTVCFNAASTIGDTIRSVAAQDWPDFEHLVIDGGSTDDTVAVAERLAHPRMRLVSEPDEGMYDAMNKGLAAAKGDYIGFLNADDFLLRGDALRLVAEAGRASAADLLMGDTLFVDEQGRPKGRLYSSWGFGRWWLRIGAMPPHPSLFVRTDAARRAGGFDTRYRIAADFDLVARMVLVHRATWERVPHAITGFRTGGISTANAAAKRTIGREAAASLARIGQPLPRLTVLLRYPLKLLQALWGAASNRRAGARRG